MLPTILLHYYTTLFGPLQIVHIILIHILTFLLADTSNIYGCQVDVTGQPFGDVAVIGDTSYFNGTLIRDHNAILVFEQTHNNYLVLFEIDLEGNDAGATNIVGRRVDIDGVPQE